MSYDEDVAEDEQDLVEPAPSPYTAPETEALLNRIAEIVENARDMPLSASSMINKEEVLELLDEAIDRLPRRAAGRSLAAQGARGVPREGPP
ncbi:MAG: hypothetical protein U5R31_12775 [Acidimicrobiia bacterium]|nr:hypothetical protein [Acidimicrobiia bacterium]